METAKKLEGMSKDERSLLLYLETCSVDRGGLVESRRMNDDDFKLADSWSEAGFIHFGRLYSHDMWRLRKPTYMPTHWCELSGEAWDLAHKERRARSGRIFKKRKWIKAEEK